MQNKSRYEPAEDTFFLADIIQNEKGNSALEVGTGSGYLAEILKSNFDLVVATDIDFDSLVSHEKKNYNEIFKIMQSTQPMVLKCPCNLLALKNQKLVH